MLPSRCLIRFIGVTGGDFLRGSVLFHSNTLYIYMIAPPKPNMIPAYTILSVNWRPKNSIRYTDGLIRLFVELSGREKCT